MKAWTRRIGVFQVVAGLALAVLAGPAPRAGAAEGIAVPGSVTAQEWGAYKAKFVNTTGRVIDDGNGGISHSESQGYGLLLAVSAQDPVGFEQIWSFTRSQMLLRDDGLVVWKWDPNAKPHVADINNATDGDILIAYALGLGGQLWREPRYTTAARSLASAIAAKTLVQVNGQTLLLPGAAGFGAKDRPDGPVVNPSYWIFEAFPVLKTLAPDTDWSKVSAGGLSVLERAGTGPTGLPPEWLSLKGTPRPADGFPVQFGYNAVRIPLYLLRGGIADPARLAPYLKAWAAVTPAVVNLGNGGAAEQLAEPGYQMVAAAVGCAAGAKRVPEALKRFSPTLYYPSTLHLLGLSLVRQRYASCL
jgi:endoglucanase